MWLASSDTPCQAQIHGCHQATWVQIAAVVVFVGGAVMAVLAWIWFRWERGPFWIVIRLLTGERPRRDQG
jgi:hypothetical protein